MNVEVRSPEMGYVVLFFLFSFLFGVYQFLDVYVCVYMSILFFLPWRIYNVIDMDVEREAYIHVLFLSLFLLYVCTNRCAVSSCSFYIYIYTSKRKEERD